MLVTPKEDIISGKGEVSYSRGKGGDSVLSLDMSAGYRDVQLCENPLKIFWVYAVHQKQFCENNNNAVVNMSLLKSIN